MLIRKHRKVHKVFSTNNKRTWKWQKMAYKIKFIDSVRFMASSLSRLADTIAKIFTIVNTKTENLVLNM